MYKCIVCGNKTGHHRSGVKTILHNTSYWTCIFCLPKPTKRRNAGLDQFGSYNSKGMIFKNV